MNRYQKMKAREEAIKRTKERDKCITLYEVLGMEKALREIYEGGEIHNEEKQDNDININR